jgi:hypothetical protein
MDNKNNKGNIYRNKDNTHSGKGHNSHTNIFWGSKGSNGSDSTLGSPG